MEHNESAVSQVDRMKHVLWADRGDGYKAFVSGFIGLNVFIWLHVLMIWSVSGK